MPQESALPSMLYENLKHHPLLALAIVKYRASKGTSSKRTSQWLVDRMEEAIALHQQDEDTSFVEKALQTTGGKVNANPANPDKKMKSIRKKKQKGQFQKEKDKKAEKVPKHKDKDKKAPKASEPPAAVNAAPGTSKGNGRGKKVHRQVQNRILQSLRQKMTKQNNRVCTLLSTHAPRGINVPTSMTKIICIKELSLKHSQRALQLVQPLFMQVLLQSCQVLSLQVRF